MHNYKILVRGVLVLAPLLGLNACHSAGPHLRTAGTVSVEGEHARVSVAFGDRERRQIREFYGARQRELPPGLAKRGKVPPGIARQIRRKQPLPGEATTQRLPADLAQRLGPPPAGHVRVRVGLDVVLIDADTRVIVDIVENAAAGP